MASTDARFTLCDIDLNGEVTPLPDLNIDVETSLTNQHIFVTKFCFNLKIIRKNFV